MNRRSWSYWSWRLGFDWIARLFARGPVDPLADIRVAMAAFVRRAQRMGCGTDTQLVLDVFGCSIRGERVGDWRFIVQRLPTAAEFEPQLEANLARRKAKRPARSAAASKGHDTRNLNRKSQARSVRV